MGEIDWLERILFVIPLVLSLSVHEWAHAYSAFRLGDHTAANLGRLTLNPIAHIDPIGSLLLPLMGVPFGWAKPVPVNPARFRRDVTMRTGMMITAAAGPASNLVLAFIGVVAYVVLGRTTIAAGHEAALSSLIWVFILINVALAIFNMLPIYPLDGSRVVDGLISHRLRPYWERFSQYSFVVLLFVIIAPRLLGISIIMWPTQQLIRLMFYIVGI